MQRDIFVVYAVAVATFVFFSLLHLSPLLSVSHVVYIGDHLPEHALVMDVSTPERHGPHWQSSNVLVKPAN